jgi:sporulation protein YlmC with PRC-barrel domain
MLRVSQIHGLPVLDSEAPRQSGIVGDVVLDLVNRRVSALDVVHGDRLLRYRVPIEEVDAIEPKMVLIPESAEREWRQTESWNSRAAGSTALVGQTIMNPEGDPVGRLRDVLVRADNLAIASLEIDAAAGLPWLRRSILPIDRVLAASADALIVDLPSPHRMPAFSPVARPRAILQHAMAVARRA